MFIEKSSLIIAIMSNAITIATALYIIALAIELVIKSIRIKKQ